jgi:hypothetical protein
VLATLERLWIRAEYSHEDEVDSVDSVRLLAPACVSATLLKVQHLDKETVVLEWPTNACGFELVSGESLDTPLDLAAEAWTTSRTRSLTREVTNGCFRVQAAAVGSGRFFRLCKCVQSLQAKQ